MLNENYLEVKIFCNHDAFYREMFRSPDGRSIGGERDKSAPTDVRMMLLKVITDNTITARFGCLLELSCPFILPHLEGDLVSLMSCRSTPPAKHVAGMLMSS